MLTGMDDIYRMWDNITNPTNYDILFKDIGQVIKDSIDQRTASGFDYFDRKFSPYTYAYKRFKMRRGFTGRVNLRLSGHMLDSLKIQRGPMMVRLHFDNEKANDRAFYNEEGREPRLFVGIPPIVEKHIDEMVSKHIDRLLGI